MSGFLVLWGLHFSLAYNCNQPSCFAVPIHLANRSADGLAGRLEVDFHGKWGTVSGHAGDGAHAWLAMCAVGWFSCPLLVAAGLPRHSGLR